MKKQKQTPNKNYIHSYNLENDVVHILERYGYWAQRGAGSHKIDVIAFPPLKPQQTGAPLWISCKYGSARESEKSKIEFIKNADRYKCFPLIATRKRGKKLEFRTALFDIPWKPTKWQTLEQSARQKE